MRVLERTIPIDQIPPSHWTATDNDGFPTRVIGTEAGVQLGDSIIYIDSAGYCYREDVVVEILTSISRIHELPGGGNRQFQFTIVDNSPERFMTTTPKSDWFTFNIPRQLLWHQAMTYELLMFMLLHEVGHAIDEPAADNRMASECMADHWASHVGLPALLGDARAAQLRFGIAQRFAEYLHGVYTESTYQNSTCSAGPGAYPSLECRMQGIIDPLWMNREDLRTNDFPDSCWSTAREPCDTPATNVSSIWASGTCDPNKRSCLPYAGGTLCGLSVADTLTIARTRTIVEQFVGYCELRPDICEQIRQAEINGTKPRSLEARRLKRVLDHSEKKLGKLRSAPNGTKNATR